MRILFQEMQLWFYSHSYSKHIDRDRRRSVTIAIYVKLQLTPQSGIYVIDSIICGYIQLPQESLQEGKAIDTTE